MLGLLFVNPWFKPFNKGLFLIIIMCRATPKESTNSRLKISLIKLFLLYSVYKFKKKFSRLYPNPELVKSIQR